MAAQSKSALPSVTQQSAPPSAPPQRPSPTRMSQVGTGPPSEPGESSFGMSEVRWLGGRQEVRSSDKGGTGTSSEGVWPVALQTKTSSVLLV